MVARNRKLPQSLHEALAARADEVGKTEAEVLVELLGRALKWKPKKAESTT